MTKHRMFSWNVYPCPDNFTWPLVAMVMKFFISGLPFVILTRLSGSWGKVRIFLFQRGETDVTTPGAAFAIFGADRGIWSCLNQHSLSWLLLLLHVFVRKHLHTIFIWSSHFLWSLSLFFFFKIVLTCFACIW